MEKIVQQVAASRHLCQQLCMLCVCVCALLVMPLGGCASSEEFAAPILAAGPPTQELSAQDGQRLVAAWLDLIDLEITPDPGPSEKSLESVGRRLGILMGYEFKADVDGWRAWYRWATQHDRRVITDCLASPNSWTQNFGVDIAFGTKDRQYK